MMTRMCDSGTPVTLLPAAEMSLASCVFSVSAWPARVVASISRGCEGAASVKTLPSGSSANVTCTKEVGAPVIDAWRRVISAANSAFCCAETVFCVVTTW